jgi:hypothetical protein
MNRLRRICIAIVIAIVGLVFASACNDGVARLVGDAGQALVDASRALDGGDDASAQLPTTIRSVTANTDSQQLRRSHEVGSNAACNTMLYEVATGPFVLTDAQHSYPYPGNGSYGRYATFFAIDAASSCPSVGTYNGVDCSVYAALDYVVSVGTDWTRVYANSNPTAVTMQLHGGNYVVPAGKRLCVMLTSGAVDWAGYVPYQ